MDNLKRIIRQHFADEHILPIEAQGASPITVKESKAPCDLSPATPPSTVEEDDDDEAPPSPSSTTPPIISENKKEESPMPKKTETSNFIIPIPTDPALLALYNECKTCKACELCDSALNLVFGDGNPQADIMLIGEAPGADEDEQGRPFVGRAGTLLVKILNKYGVQREDIFIANILKHRPPNNRNPLTAEIAACTPFLRKQIDIIKPKLLITLGNFSSQYILETKVGITQIRGSIQESSYGMVMPSLHPSAIIRGAYPVALLEGDLVKALQYVGYDVTIEE